MSKLFQNKRSIHIGLAIALIALLGLAVMLIGNVNSDWLYFTNGFVFALGLSLSFYTWLIRSLSKRGER